MVMEDGAQWKLSIGRGLHGLDPCASNCKQHTQVFFSAEPEWSRRATERAGT